MSKIQLESGELFILHYLAIQEYLNKRKSIYLMIYYYEKTIKYFRFWGNPKRI